MSVVPLFDLDDAENLFIAHPSARVPVSRHVDAKVNVTGNAREPRPETSTMSGGHIWYSALTASARESSKHEAPWGELQLSPHVALGLAVDFCRIKYDERPRGTIVRVQNGSCTFYCRIALV